MAENKPAEKETQKTTRKAAKETDAESAVLATIAALVKRAVQHRSLLIYHIVSESDFRAQLAGSTETFLATGH